MNRPEDVDVSLVDDEHDDPSAQVDSQLPLSEDERRVLKLYDQLQQLRLEIAIINAQSVYRPGMPALCGV